MAGENFGLSLITLGRAGKLTHLTATSYQSLAQASSNGGACATCGTLEARKTKKIKGNFGKFGTLTHSFEDPCSRVYEST